MWWDNPLEEKEDQEKDQIRVTFGEDGFSRSINIGNGLSMDIDSGEIETDVNHIYQKDFNGNLKRKL